MTIRYVATFVNAQRMRTLMTAAQGQHTYGSSAEAQAWLDAVIANNSAERLRSIWGDNPRFAVRPVECHDGHFDPMSVWFAEGDGEGAAVSS